MDFNDDADMDDEESIAAAIALSMQEYGMGSTSTAADMSGTAVSQSTAAMPTAHPAPSTPGPSSAPTTNTAADLATALRILMQQQGFMPPAAAPATAPMPAASSMSTVPATVAPPATTAAPAAAAQAPGQVHPDLFASLTQQMQMFQQLQQQMQQQGGQGHGQQASTRARPASAAVHTSPPMAAPAWASSLQQWWKPMEGGPQTLKSISVPVSELTQALSVLSKSLKLRVITDVAQAAGDTIYLRTGASTSGVKSVTAQDVDALLSMWLGRSNTRSRARLQAYHRVFDDLPAPSALIGGVKDTLDLVAAALARNAFALLRDEEGDDLYFDKGMHLQEFASALQGGTSTMCVPFLDAMIDAAVTPQDGAAWARILRDLLKEFSSKEQEQLKGVQQLQPAFVMLQTLMTSGKMQQCLASLLLDETLRFSRGGAGSGRALESSCILSPLLGVGTLVDATSVIYKRDVASRAREALTALRNYPSASPGEIQMLMRLLQGIISQVHSAGEFTMRQLLKVKDGKVCHEVLLSWLSMVAAINSERTLGGEAMTQLDPVKLTAGCSENFMVNLVAICMRLCKPFVDDRLALHSRDPKGAHKPKFPDLFDKLDPVYYTTQPHRLGDLSKTAALGGERGVGLMEASATHAGFLAPTINPQASFMADIFFLTQRLIHVGLSQALNRHNILITWQRRVDKQGGEDSDDEEQPNPRAGRRPPSLQLQLLHNCNLTMLQDPVLADEMVRFGLVELDWLSSLLRAGKASAFRTIPEYALVDVLRWLEFLLQYGQSEIVASKPVGLLMDALVGLLDAPTAVKSPLVHAKIVSLLLTMLSPQIAMAGTRLGASHLSSGQNALVAAVLGTPAAQTQLLPALMHAYVGADYVVGLDVDKDQFDKFSMRSNIDSIFNELWQDAKIRDNFRSLASSPPTAGGSAFSDYIGAVLNGLMYLLKDSFDRLADITKLEASIADTAAWAALPAAERDTKMRFYQSQQSTGRGFLPMAVRNLNWLLALTHDLVIASTFLRPPLIGRAAYACVSFVDLLVGPSCTQLQVKHPESYGFDRPALMETVLGLMLQLGQHAEFIKAVAEEPDFDLKIFQRALQQLEDQHQAMLSSRLTYFLQQLPASRTAASGQPGTLHAKRPKASGARTSGSGTDVNGNEVRAGDVEMEEASDTSALASSDLTFTQPALEGAALDAAYKAALADHMLGTFDSSRPAAYNRHYASMAEEAQGTTPAKMKRLTRELKAMAGVTALPCSAAASIFLRHDEDRVDKMRVIISGPVDTPYEGGLFVFDVFFPAGYPSVAPLMTMHNTGDGRGRYNPNLYADGKVCLSLLGTWHSSNETEKWNAESSTLFQVAMSIQGQVLVEDPYFNEPNNESVQATSEGKEMSARYNGEVQLHVLRYAMMDVLRRPPPGFEDVVSAHFRLLRHRILATCQLWVRAAAWNPQLQARLDAALVELHGLLAAL